MVIVLDENVSLAPANVLRQAGHDVIAIAETADRGLSDVEVWEEVALVRNFLAAHKFDEYKGCLVTLWPGGARIRC